MGPIQECCGLIDEWASAQGGSCFGREWLPMEAAVGCVGDGSQFGGESLDFFLINEHEAFLCILYLFIHQIFNEHLLCVRH